MGGNGFGDTDRIQSTDLLGGEADSRLKQFGSESGGCTLDVGHKLLSGGGLQQFSDDSTAGFGIDREFGVKSFADFGGEEDSEELEVGGELSGFGVGLDFADFNGLLKGSKT